KKARQQFVRVGPSRGDYVGILQGVTAGQELVTSGAFKLHNGSAGLIDNSKPMTPKLDPRPQNRQRPRAGANLRFTDTFIRRPVLAIVVNLVIIVAGIQAIRSLNVRQYPKLESASVTVRTAYVGANADLVRGFITTPLERSIAAADGIDYIESQSVQGLSTISVRLKLNFPAAGARSDISARVNQVRAALPPEAEIPSINIEPSDAQFAAMYLSFGSKILEDNQVTDYLIRVVQPRLSAIEGVQKADILGGRT